jgi:hypothetical protein
MVIYAAKSYDMAYFLTGRRDNSPVVLPVLIVWHAKMVYIAIWFATGSI